MYLLQNPEILLELHDQLEKLQEEIDNDENVPDRFSSTLAAVASEQDSSILAAASSVLHRLHLNAKYQGFRGEGNYVKFNQEVTNG